MSCDISQGLFRYWEITSAIGGYLNYVITRWRGLRWIMSRYLLIFSYFFIGIPTYALYADRRRQKFKLETQFVSFSPNIG